MIDEKSFDKALAKLGEPDTFNFYDLDSGNLRSFLASYLAAEAEHGRRMMPREPTPEMLRAGSVISMGSTERAIAGYYAKDAWAAMFDAAKSGGEE